MPVKPLHFQNYRNDRLCRRVLSGKTTNKKLGTAPSYSLNLTFSSATFPSLQPRHRLSPEHAGENNFHVVFRGPQILRVKTCQLLTQAPAFKKDHIGFIGADAHTGDTLNSCHVSEQMKARIEVSRHLLDRGSVKFCVAPFLYRRSKKTGTGLAAPLRT